MVERRVVQFITLCQLLGSPDRSMLLVLLTIATGGVPILENPNSTLLNCHARFKHIVSLLRARGWSTLGVCSVTFVYFPLYWIIVAIIYCPLPKRFATEPLRESWPPDMPRPCHARLLPAGTMDEALRTPVLKANALVEHISGSGFDGSWPHQQERP